MRFGLVSLLFLLLCPVSLCAQDVCPADSTSIAKSNHSKAATITSVAIPTLMVTYGFISLDDNAIRRLDYNVSDKLNERKHFLDNNLCDYFQYSPAVAAFSMKLAGLKSTHKLSDMAILYTLSMATMTGVVYTTKNIVHRTRPDGSENNSFPSGHTGTAFVAAEFLHQEYKDQSIWISVGGYTMATLVGVSRVYNNRHWVSDVVAGAGIGILSTKLVYWTYPYLQKAFQKKDAKQGHAFIYPSYSNGNIGLNFSCSF